jgi:hypothetical protein
MLVERFKNHTNFSSSSRINNFKTLLFRILFLVISECSYQLLNKIAVFNVNNLK